MLGNTSSCRKSDAGAAVAVSPGSCRGSRRLRDVSHLSIGIIIHKWRLLEVYFLKEKYGTAFQTTKQWPCQVLFLAPLAGGHRLQSQVAMGSLPRDPPVVQVDRWVEGSSAPVVGRVDH